MDRVLRYWPIVLTATTLIAAGAVGQFQLGALAGEVNENKEDIEENEDEIEAIQRRLIERQGQIGLDLERLRIQQAQQNQKLDDVLRLLREPSND